MSILKDPKFQELLKNAIAEEARDMERIRKEGEEKRNKVNQRLEEYDIMFSNQQRGRYYDVTNDNDSIWNRTND